MVGRLVYANDSGNCSSLVPIDELSVSLSHICRGWVLIISRRSRPTGDSTAQRLQCPHVLFGIDFRYPWLPQWHRCRIAYRYRQLPLHFARSSSGHTPFLGV